MAEFKIVTASGRGVAERWMSTYCDNGKWRNTAMGNSGDVYKRICALGPTPDPDAVAAAIGNKSWTHILCSGCGEYVGKAVEMGDCYSQPIRICRDCASDIAGTFERGGK